MHAEREGGTAAGGEKRRPRADWLVQRDTHPALIADAEAEAILAQQERALRVRRVRGSPMLLSGILEAPDGTAWHSDGCGYYRLAKGRKFKAERVDQAVLGRLGDDLASDSTVQLVLLALEQLARGDSKPVDGRSLAALEKRVATLTTQIGRTVDLAAVVEDPAPILRRVSDLEHRRVELVAQLDELRARKQQAASADAIGPEQVRTLSRGLMLEIAERSGEPDHRAEARKALGEVQERVVLDPDLHTVRLHYAVATGVNLASPRGFEPL